MLRIKPVDLACDGHYRQSIGIVQCHGEAQKSQLPGAQCSSVPVTLENACTHLKCLYEVAAKSVPGSRLCQPSLKQARSSSPISAMARATSAFAGSASSTIGKRVIGRHQAKQAQRIFQGGRALFGECNRQPRQPVLQISCRLQPSLPAARENSLAQSRRDIRYRRYAAIPAKADKGKRGGVVSGQ